MHTITFYSYKGGSGRTLALANVAQYLARLGQHVVALDFDLEAPGLHYKFFLDRPDEQVPVQQGLVDCIHLFLTEGKTPDAISPYVFEVPPPANCPGRVTVFPAGAVPTPDYWRKLSAINWREFLYDEDACGIAFLLDIKERIREELKPDFLLIDARTGITEMGGVASAVLPETLVCLLSHTRESLEGTRSVLRSLKQTPRPPGADPLDMVPVLTRVPAQDVSEERQLAENVRAFLSEEAPDVKDTLNIESVFVLHSEAELQIRESLRMSDKRTIYESVLLCDYFRLFSRAIPAKISDRLLEQMTREIANRAYENPDLAQKQLASLVALLPHPEGFRLLMMFQKLRGAPIEERFGIAKKFWEIFPREAALVVLPIVKEKIHSGLDGTETSFLEDVWWGTGCKDVEIAMQQLVDTSQRQKFKEAVRRRRSGPGSSTGGP